MGFLSNLLKQAEAQVNPWDHGQTAATVKQQQQRPQAAQLPSPGLRPPTNRANREYNSGAEQLQMPHLSNPIPSLHNFATKSFAQLNPLDGGRTWKNAAPTNDASLIHQATHNGLTNVAGGIGKFVPQTAANFSNTFANLGDRAAGLQGQSIQHNFNDPLSRGIVKMSGATGTNKQLAGDAIQVGASMIPGAGKAVSNVASKAGLKVAGATLPILGKAVNRGITYAGDAAAGAGTGAIFGGASALANEPNAGIKDVLRGGLEGAKYGAVLGGAAPMLGDAVKVGKSVRAAGKGNTGPLKSLLLAPPNPHPDISPEKLSAISRVYDARTGGPQAEIRPGDTQIYNSVVKQKGYDPADATGAGHILTQMAGYEAKKQAVNGGYIQDPFRAAMDKSKQLVGQYQRVANQGEKLAGQVDRAHNIARKGNGTSSEQMALGKFMNQKLGLKSLDEGGFVDPTAIRKQLGALNKQFKALPEGHPKRNTIANKMDKLAQNLDEADVRSLQKNQAGSVPIGEIGHSIRQAVNKFSKPLDQTGSAPLIEDGSTIPTIKKLAGKTSTIPEVVYHGSNTDYPAGVQQKLHDANIFGDATYVAQTEAGARAYAGKNGAVTPYNVKGLKPEDIYHVTDKASFQKVLQGAEQAYPGEPSTTAIPKYVTGLGYKAIATDPKFAGRGELAIFDKSVLKPQSGGKQPTGLSDEAAPAKVPGEQAGGIASGNSTPKMSIPEDAPSSGLRQRGLSRTIMEDPNTPTKVKQGIGELYKVRNTKDLQSRAANLVKDDPNLAMRVFKSDSNSDVGTMIGGELSAHLSRTGQHEAALEVAQTMSREATNRGQANQALSAWGKLAPESILRFAQSTVNEYNKSANLTGTARELTLSPDQAKKITGMSEDLQKMAPGHDKDIATKQLLNEVKQIVPASWVQKLSTLQTIGQLLNPKTLIRNIAGNGMFSGLENASQVLAAGIDKGLSTARGTERTVALPNLKTQAKGFVAGGKAQYAETAKGVNLGPDTQFDLADVPAFRDGVMGSIEKTMGMALRVPDRAAFQAAYDDTVQGLMKANKLDKPTQSILDQAEANGLYRTFQDNSKAARLFAGLKKSLNNVGFEGKDGKQWGLGDLILKYPKTPGNILARGMDYSPAGIVKGIAQVGIHAAQGKPFDQAAFANSIARGVVGTGALVGTGAALGALGIITEKPSQDTDTRNLQKDSGLGGYQINTSALKRFIASGFKKSSANLRQGDTLVSYDWAQPASIPLSAGAALGKGKSGIDGATSTLENASSGLNSLVEQPLVTGVNTFANNIKNKGIVGALGESAKGAPASFVPTASNQVRQLTDNNTRNVYDPSGARQALNMVLNKVPGLDRNLPNKVGPLGENLQNYQNGSNNVFNVAFNPAFVNKYQPNGSANLPLDILQRSGNTKQIPTTTKTSQNVNGTNVKLTANQNHDFQKFVGDQTKQMIDQRLTDPTFMALDDQAKADDISKQISSIQAAARAKLLGDTPSKSQAKAVDKVLTGNLVYTPKGSRSTNGTPPVPKNPHPMPKTISTTYDDKTKTWTQTSSKTGRVTKISADGTRTVVNPGTTAKKSGSSKRASSGGRKSSGNSPSAALAGYTKHSSSNTAKYENSLRSLVARTLKAPKVKGTSSKTAKAKKYKAPSVKMATNPRPRKAFA